jgi:hypothetical protein
VGSPSAWASSESTWNLCVGNKTTNQPGWTQGRGDDLGTPNHHEDTEDIQEDPSLILPIARAPKLNIIFLLKSPNLIHFFKHVISKGSFAQSPFDCNSQSVYFSRTYSQSVYFSRTSEFKEMRIFIRG